MNLEQKPLVIGADIGGSHITAAIINVDEQCLIESSRVRNPVNTHGTAEEILSVWASTLAKIIGDSDPHKISLGIAMPGPFDYKNGISLITNMNKYESLYLIDVKKFLVESLRLRPENIVFTNDAEAFLHGEVNCGGARCFSRALGVTLGTGLGSAVSTDGLTVDSNLGVSPFKEGIAEDYISTRWFVKRYAELTGKQVKDTKTLVGLYAQDPVIAVLFNDFCVTLQIFCIYLP